MKKPLLLIVGLLFPCIFTSCDNGRDKEVCVIEQFSTMNSEWEKVLLVYGYWDNQDAAEKIMKAWEPLAERKLRVIPKKISRGEYNKMTNTISKTF
jgi:hypothetical protein